MWETLPGFKSGSVLIYTDSQPADYFFLVDS